MNHVPIIYQPLPDFKACCHGLSDVSLIIFIGEVLLGRAAAHPTQNCTSFFTYLATIAFSLTAATMTAPQDAPHEPAQRSLSVQPQVTQPCFSASECIEHVNSPRIPLHTLSLL